MSIRRRVRVRKVTRITIRKRKGGGLLAGARFKVRRGKRFRKIIGKSKLSYNKAYDAGFDEAYNEGFNIGYNEGIASGQQEVIKGEG